MDLAMTVECQLYVRKYINNRSGKFGMELV